MANQQKSSSDGMRLYWRTVRYVGLIVLCAVLLSAILITLCNDMFAFVKAEESFTIVITENNDTAGDIAQELKVNGIINNAAFFRIYATLTHNTELSLGTFELNSSMGYETILLKVGKKNAPKETVNVTIPEGYTQSEIFALLEEKGVCTVAELQQSVLEDTYSYSFLEGKTPSERWLEGYLFPDTYTFYVDDTPKRVIKKFLSNFGGKFSSSLRKRAQDQGMTMEEVVIIASMVEREAKLDAERKVIASVIFNRMESPNFPCLQIDATVYYALGEHKSSLTAEDLKVDSPYNTYVVQGLPAGPIGNPGLDSLYAVLYATDTSYFYYVARPNGSHYFAKNLTAHQANIKKAADEFAAKAAEATAAPSK